MKQLSLKEISKILNQFTEIAEYIEEELTSWEDYIMTRGLYIIRAEIILMDRIYKEVGLNVDFKFISALYLVEDFFENLDVMYEMESVMDKFIYPSATFMQSKGWEDTEHFLDTSMKFDNNDCYNWTEEQKIHECKKMFGEFTDVFSTDLSCLLVDVKEDTFESCNTHFMKCERAGKFLDYAEVNEAIKESELFERINNCIDTITNPFQCYYPHLTGMQIYNGCLYAYSSGGRFTEWDESVTSIHGKMARYLCVELLDQLLSMAEKEYGYLKSDSL